MTLTRLAFALMVLIWVAAHAPVGHTEERPTKLKERAPEEGNEDAEEEAEAARRHEAARAAFVKRVNEAIDRGAAFLKGSQSKDGTWSGVRFGAKNNTWSQGEHALCLLTLLKCGVGASDPAIRRGLKALRGTPTTSHHTYEHAVRTMLFDALGDKRNLRKELAWFEQTQRNQVWRYGRAVPHKTPEDLSCTQYALLALWTLAQNGKPLKPSRLRRVLAYMLDQQQKDGPEVAVYIENPVWKPGGRYDRFFRSGKAKARGWGYTAPASASGGMTVAGVASLAIVKDLLSSAKGKHTLTATEGRAIDRALRSGIAWLDRHFSVQTNPKKGTAWLYYYLYGLERVGTLLGLKTIGKRDWYRRGAEFLLSKQERTGSWPARGQASGYQSRHVNTCFALLFLKRATVPPRKPLAPPAVTGQ